MKFGYDLRMEQYMGMAAAMGGRQDIEEAALNLKVFAEPGGKTRLSHWNSPPAPDRLWPECESSAPRGRWDKGERSYLVSDVSGADLTTPSANFNMNARSYS